MQIPQEQQGPLATVLPDVAWQRNLNADQLRALLRRGRIRFVVNDAGRRTVIPDDACFDF